MQSAFTARCTEPDEKWQLYTYICWHVEFCAKLFNNIGLLSISAKGATLAGWCSPRDLFPFTGALVPLKNTFTIQHKKNTKANDPYLSQNLLSTQHISHIFHSKEK